MEKFFKFIQKINSVLLLLVFLAAGLGFAWIMLIDGRRGQHVRVVNSDATDDNKTVMTLNFDVAEDIPGTDTQMLRLSSGGRYSKFSSGAKDNGTRNVLFLTGADKKMHWLFKEHKNLILLASPLHGLGNDGDEHKRLATKAFYVEYVTQDSNGDAKLSEEDHRNIALANADGTGVVEVLRDVTNVLNHEMDGGQAVSILYQRGKTLRHARFSLPSLKLEKDQEIVQIPTAHVSAP